jgi:hypothetical protein
MIHDSYYGASQIKIKDFNNIKTDSSCLSERKNTSISIHSRSCHKLSQRTYYFKMILPRAASAILGATALLSNYSYDDPYSNIFSDVTTIPKTYNGPYKVVWGPVEMNGTLTYVAKGADGSLAIANRGTDNSKDIIYDLEIAPTPWIYPSNWNGQVTTGMNDAFNDVISGRDPSTGTTLGQFLSNFNGNPTLYVTGHSMGGAVANLVAAYVNNQLPAYNVQPITFAAPTVTDQNFAIGWNKVFGNTAVAVTNGQDVVPMTWNNLGDVLWTYSPPGEALEDYADGVLEATVIGFQLSIDYFCENNSFCPTSLGANPLSWSNSICANLNWLDQAIWQHSIELTYLPFVLSGKTANC